MTGRYGHYIEDPYVEVVPREPLTDEVTVALIGGGFAGLVTAARLVQAGITDVRIIEKGGDFGGTWYWNRYPGAQCDVESYIYLPLLEETGYVPKEKYSHAPEIQEHCRRLGEHFGLYDNACLSTEVTVARVGRRRVALDHRHQPRRRHARAVRRHRRRAAAPAEAAGHPRHRGLRGPQLPHEPVGLRLHRRRHDRRARRPSRQAGGHHRHRRHRGAGGALPRRGVRAALRVPAHAVVDRRARQPPHRPRVGGVAAARLADRADRQLHRPHRRRVRRPRTW